MAINKVDFGNRNLIDLTNDTVTPEKLMSGETAHDKSGNLVTGIAQARKPEQRKSATYENNGTYHVNPDNGKVLSGVDITVNCPKPQLGPWSRVETETWMPVVDTNTYPMTKLEKSKLLNIIFTANSYPHTSSGFEFVYGAWESYNNYGCCICRDSVGFKKASIMLFLSGNNSGIEIDGAHKFTLGTKYNVIKCYK